MEECDFASRILEEFDSDDCLMIENLLGLRSESLANQFKSDASAVLHSNNRQYGPITETITINNHEVAAATSASDDVLHSKNRQCATASETIIENNHEVAAGTSVAKIDASDDVLHSKNQHYAFASETITRFNNSNVKNNETSNEEFKNPDVKNKKITAEDAVGGSVRKITFKIKRSDPSLKFVYGNSNTKNDETATEKFNNSGLKNNETSTKEFKNSYVKNNETTAEELNNPNTKNNETTAEESLFDESSNTKVKKRKANKKKSSEPSNKRKKKINTNGRISPHPEVDEPGLPLEFKEKIEQMGGVEVKLVIQKELTNSDVTQDQGRLTIPKGRVKESFLTASEESYLDYERNKDEKIPSMYVSMLDHNLNLWDEMCLKKWKMTKAEIYSITEGWNELVAENDWKKDEKVLVQLWSFRRNHKLYFALVKL
ncbi:unnamed protein product [Lathyrus sativus]|nr:unnamed protein product [Lathyrus sativus]